MAWTRSQFQNPERMRRTGVEGGSKRVEKLWTPGPVYSCTLHPGAGLRRIVKINGARNVSRTHLSGRSQHDPEGECQLHVARAGRGTAARTDILALLRRSAGPIRRP